MSTARLYRGGPVRGRAARPVQSMSPSEEVEEVMERMYTEEQLNDRVVRRTLEYKEELDTFIRDANKTEKALKESRDELHEAQQELDETKTQIKALKKKVKHLEMATNGGREENGSAELVAERDSLKAKLAARIESEDSLMAKYTTLNRDSQQVRETSTQLQVQNASLSKQRLASISKIAALEKQIHDLKATHQKQISDIMAANQKQIDAIKTTNETAKSEVERSHASELATKATQVSKLTKEVSRERTMRHVDVQVARSSWDTEKTSLTKALAEARKQMADQKRVFDVAMARRRLNRSIVEPALRQQLEAEYAWKLAGEKARIERDTREGIRSLVFAKGEIEKKARAVEERSKVLVEEVEGLKCDNEVLLKEKEAAEAQTSLCEATSKSLKRKLEIAEGELKKAGEEIASVKKIKVEKREAE